MIYARLFADVEEVDSIISKLLENDPFFTEINGKCDKSETSNNFQCGLDVEKLNFQVKERAEVEQDFRIVVGIKRTNPNLISKRNSETAEIIYENFGVNLRAETQPDSFIPLLVLLLITLTIYFGILRKYQLRIFV